MYRLLVVLFLLALSACATLDISSLDTALPVAPAKAQIAPYQAIGLDMASAVYHDSDGTDEDRYASVDVASGIKANISLKPDLDLQLRGYIGTGNSRGFKLGVKKIVRTEGRHHLAIAPAFNYIEENPAENADKSRAFGAEMQVLYTQKWGSSSATFVLRGNYEKYLVNGWDWDEAKDYREYDLVHGGLRINLCFRSKYIYFIPELGFEIVPVINGKLSMIPALGYALGVEF